MDRKFSCDDVFKALGTTTAVALFASFFPGASSVANVGAKSAYYGVRAANTLTNLAQKLRKSSTILWRVVSAVIKVPLLELMTAALLSAFDSCYTFSF